MTQRERYIAALERRGERVVKETSRYTVYTATTFRPMINCYFYVGKLSALLIGKNSRTAVPVSEALKDTLLRAIAREEGDPNAIAKTAHPQGAKRK